MCPLERGVQLAGQLPNRSRLGQCLSFENKVELRTTRDGPPDLREPRKPESEHTARFLFSGRKCCICIIDQSCNPHLITPPTAHARARPLTKRLPVQRKPTHRNLLLRNKPIRNRPICKPNLKRRRITCDRSERRARKLGRIARQTTTGASLASRGDNPGVGRACVEGEEEGVGSDVGQGVVGPVDGVVSGWLGALE